MYDVTISAIHEQEDREFSPIGTVAQGCCRSDATEFAQTVANELDPVVWVLCRMHDCDGIAVSVTSERLDRAIAVYVLFPGRPIDAYHGNDCD